LIRCAFGPNKQATKEKNMKATDGSGDEIIRDNSFDKMAGIQPPQFNLDTRSFNGINGIAPLTASSGGGGAATQSAGAPSTPPKQT